MSRVMYSSRTHPGNGRKYAGAVQLLIEAQNRSNFLFLRNSGRKTASHFSWSCSGAGKAGFVRKAWQQKAARFPGPLACRCLKSAQMSLAKATAVSDMRLEKPHSLSYQDRTRTKLPSMTLV
ncbi:hypothetical protein GFL28_17730 [Rhizobium leguminosarum bv. viciae]|uniref:Uncharacterized protein n=1 Tax=Rhizobium leguminosarum TaxID=384 RepID=A0A7M3DZM2_RHILE|nr:hypothetical protein [Rhizobium leguminosarum bv. viciae]TAY54025.1 hypothetical protein ELH90_21555 [Rhizobium leguminosarum]